MGAIAGGAIGAFVAIAALGLFAWYKIRTHPRAESGAVGATEQYPSPGGDRPQNYEEKMEGVAPDSEREPSRRVFPSLKYPGMPETPSGRVAGTSFQSN